MASLLEPRHAIVPAAVLSRRTSGLWLPARCSEDASHWARRLPPSQNVRSDDCWRMPFGVASMTAARHLRSCRRSRHESGSDGKRPQDSDDSPGHYKDSRDTDVAPEFTAQFNTYAARYYSPWQTFLRWCSGRFAGPRERRLVWERTMAALGYIVPLAIQVRLLQPHIPSNAVLNLIATITGPLVQPLYLAMASSWLFCGASDERAVPSDFVRGHLRQALLMTMLSAVLMFQTGLFPTAEVYSEASMVYHVIIAALSPIHGLRSGILGAINLLWLVCVMFCLTGRKMARISAASSAARSAGR
eukprot:TRINITY_DN106486_c0_g1_i1.p1 TRINITY_DN106486_c0_g1~~TRINITY_DN106486_c0_g1_i1.p1  ORF type:complete len:315 (+),score=25.71 TRINITY_DN106486_c0_g1_i1:42-947(+)